MARFITFEGIDGSGKSTALRAVAEALQATEPVWTTNEETDHLGPAIRRSISGKADPLVTTYLFVADRFHHVPEIRRHLESGETVLCDRYLHSTLAYQGATLEGRVVDHRRWLQELHVDMPRPDVTLWFDVEPDVAVARATSRGETAPYEKVDFLAKVRAEYAALAQADERVVRIDAGGTPEQVAQAAIAALA